MTTKTTHTLTSLIDDCVAAASREGYEGSAASYDMTPADCDFVVAELGRKPTRDEWADAGYRHVGSRHVADDE